MTPFDITHHQTRSTMLQKLTPALFLTGLLLLTRCKGDQRDELTKRLDEIQAVKENTWISRAERKKRIDSLSRHFSHLYPSALPIGKDSTSKIFRTPLPDTLQGFRRVDYFTTTSKPGATEDSVVLYPKKDYFTGEVNYALFRGKSRVPKHGLLVIVRDEGYAAEWFGAALQDMTLKGKHQGIFAPNMRSHEFMQDVEYAGQKWAVWYDQPRPRHVSSRVFMAQWNHRFSIVAVTTDTSVHRPDFVGKVIDFAWLSQLKYPAH